MITIELDSCISSHPAFGIWKTGQAGIGRLLISAPFSNEKSAGKQPDHILYAGLDIVISSSLLWFLTVRRKLPGIDT
jgi:hypothetical protein